MQATKYPEVNKILDVLLFEMQRILADKLKGLYLYGSLCTGDFDFSISDIDLLAALETEISDEEFNLLKNMHTKLAKDHEEWKDRIEVQYMSLDALKTFKTKTSKIANISPGEPFHFVEAGKDWLVNWFVVQEKGLTLYGPPPSKYIEYITKEEFIEIIRDHTKLWSNWINGISRKRGSQAYAIITLCRAYYAIKHGEQISKIKAALWMQKHFPEWAGLIGRALKWRENQWNDQSEDQLAYSETKRFVNTVIKEAKNI